MPRQLADRQKRENRKPKPRSQAKPEAGGGSVAYVRSHQLLFCVLVGLLVLVPLAMSTAVYSTIVLPKFAVLTFGASAALFALALTMALSPDRGEQLRLLRSKLVALVGLYVVTIAVSTLFGVAPLASFFGSYESQMGLITYLCFFICFIALIVALGESERLLSVTLWAMTVAGLLIAAYAFAQFVGRDPILSSSAYTFKSPRGPVVRVPGTLGHSNYLGNFLLYTTPIAAALAIVSGGRARRVAIAGAALSVVAIVLSGTRGAWIGLIAGAIYFVGVQWRVLSLKRSSISRGQAIGAAIVGAVILVSILLSVASPRFSSVLTRARSFAADGMTGSGRTILWRDALKMVPAYAVIGCGPEGFSKALLEYKSDRLAREAPQINNESSHNLYLDAAISYGLVGAILNVAVLASAFSLLSRARRRAKNRRTQVIVIGITASLVGVCVHNLFIYNQIPTGLYFFSFIALALVAWNVEASPQRDSAAFTVRDSSPVAPVPHRIAATGVVLATLALLVLAGWYAVGMMRSDMAIKRAFNSAAAGNLDELVSNGEQAVAGSNPASAYDFLFARALAGYIDRTPLDVGLGNGSAYESPDMVAKHSRAIELAMTHAERSLSHSLTPEANCVLLAYLAFVADDKEKLRDYAEQAVRWDPKLFSARWLMAEAMLAEGDRSKAESNAQIAVALNPSSLEAHLTLARVQDTSGPFDRRIQYLLMRAQKAQRKGKLALAQSYLLRSVREPSPPCPPCHRALAVLYETEERWEAAIAEWQTFSRETTDPATREQADSRIERLRRQAGGN